MGFWTISIGPVKEVTDSNLQTGLNIIAEEVRSYRVPSKVLIARYAQEKRRFNQGEIDTFEEIAASATEEVETISIALRELAAPLMEPPSDGPSFHEFLKADAFEARKSSQGRASNA